MAKYSGECLAKLIRFQSRIRSNSIIYGATNTGQYVQVQLSVNQKVSNDTETPVKDDNISILRDKW